MKIQEPRLSELGENYCRLDHSSQNRYDSYTNPIQDDPAEYASPREITEYFGPSDHLSPFKLHKAL